MRNPMIESVNARFSGRSLSLIAMVRPWVARMREAAATKRLP